jgi:hypothetical protein
VRNHPAVSKLSHQNFIGYDDAERLLRIQTDEASLSAVKEIDTARELAKVAALSLNKMMAGRLGLSLEIANAVVSQLAAAPEIETWLLRRVNLARAHGRPPADDEHPQNE